MFYMLLKYDITFGLSKHIILLKKKPFYIVEILKYKKNKEKTEANLIYPSPSFNNC